MVTHSKNEEHWSVRVRILATKMGMGRRFLPYERHSEPGTTTKSHSSAGKTHQPALCGILGPQSPTADQTGAT